MPTVWALAGVLCLAFLAQAEVFRYSSGWSPGQQSELTASASVVSVASSPSPSPSPSPSSSPPITSPSAQAKFTWSSLVTSGPIGSLLARSGINATEKLAEAQAKNQLPWDDRIPMITDSNFEHLLFNEVFATPEEEAQRVWFIIVSAARNQRTSLSLLVDQEFNKAYNISLAQDDLPHLRWGRIDYLNVTKLTTKWAVWKAPMFVFVMDRGKTLRFLSPHALGGKSDAIREFLTKGTHLRLYPWVGPWAPGGKYEGIVDKFAIFQEFLYLYMSRIPSWLLMMLSGALGSLLLTVFHRKPSKLPQKAVPRKVPSQPVDVPNPLSQTVQPVPSSPKSASGTGTVSRRKKKN